MNRYVATYNESALLKLRALGFRHTGRSLTFMEDDLASARVFFRRYIRNFFNLKLHEVDFSLYEVPAAPPSRMGFLSKDDEPPQARPGMCGAKYDQSPSPTP